MSKQSQSTHFQLSPPKRSKKTSLQKLESLVGTQIQIHLHLLLLVSTHAASAKYKYTDGPISRLHRLLWNIADRSMSRFTYAQYWHLFQEIWQSVWVLNGQTAFNSWNYVDATGSLALDKQTYCASGASADKTFSPRHKTMICSMSHLLVKN